MLLSGMITAGIGAITERALAIPSNARLNFAEKGLLGLLVLGTIGLALNFIMALGVWVPALAALSGFAGLVIFSGAIRASLGKHPGKTTVLGIILTLGVALGAYVAPQHPDLGLYHFQTILWQHESPVPLGIANLELKLGYNSLWLTIAAMLWLPFLELTSVFAVNALIVALVLLALAQRVFDEDHLAGRGWSHLFALACLVILVVTTFRGTGSPNTDYPPALLNIYAFFLATRLAEASGAGRNAHYLADLIMLVIVVTLAIASKLSQLPLALLPMLFIPALASETAARRQIIPALVFSITVFSLWSLRSLALSGCVVFPQSQTCISSLPWATAIDQVIGHARLIHGWGRQSPGITSEALQSWAWVPGWLRYMYEYKIVWLPQLLCLVAMAGWAYAALMRRARPDAFLLLPATRFMPIWAIALGGLVFWFFAGPDIRFGYGFLISAPMLLFAYGLYRAGWPRLTHSGSRTFVFILAGILLLHAGYMNRNSGFAALTAPWPELETVATKEHRNHQGVTIYSPGEKDECWWQRPCTISFNPEITVTRLWIWPMFQGMHKKTP